jgi:hypothetical protein
VATTANITQAVAELAVQQNLANVEVRSSQQVVETLFKLSAYPYSFVTKQTAEVAVQNSVNNFVRHTQQVVEVLAAVPLNEDAYDNYDAQPISVML